MMNTNQNEIAWNEITVENTWDMSIDELTILSNRIYDEMNAFVENCEKGTHSAIFAHILLNMFLTKDDITDNGDVVFMLNMYNEMISLSNTIAKVK